MVCQLKKRQPTLHTHLVCGITSSERCRCIGSWRDSRPLCMSAKQKKMACSLPLARCFSLTLRCRDRAGRCLVPSRGQEHGALIIIALIRINRGRKWRRRAFKTRPVWQSGADNEDVSGLRWKTTKNIWNISSHYQYQNTNQQLESVCSQQQTSTLFFYVIIKLSQYWHLPTTDAGQTDWW